MRVLVTGGTGFVGSHTVVALLAAGHEVRLLVRSPDRIDPALRPHGVPEKIDHVVGDVTDPSVVERALVGCDAVLHAAAVFSMDARSYAETRRTNAAGAGAVLRAALEHGCDPVVHVSSTVAVLRPRATVTPDSPLAAVRTAYVRSKVESEAVARDLQREGAPVVIVQPGSVYGPHDPHLSDQVRRLRNILRGLYPMWPSGGVHTVDVREVARLHAAVMVSGAGPRSFLVPGHFIDSRTLFGTLRALTGRRLPHVVVPASALLPVTWLASAAQRILPFQVPAEYEGVVILGSATHCDDSRARQQLGIEPRPFAETIRDTVQWLWDAGHITARQAGVVASA
jgi:dihydroflavonol-4-reductase